MGVDEQPRIPVSTLSFIKSRFCFGRSIQMQKIPVRRMKIYWIPIVLFALMLGWHDVTAAADEVDYATANGVLTKYCADATTLTMPTEISLSILLRAYNPAVKPAQR